jgi:hypothetical protein
MAAAVYLAVLSLVVVAFVAALLAVLAARERRAARAGRLSVVPARVLCPIVDRVTRVGLGRAAGDGRLGVLWCERLGEAPLRCDRKCFGAAIAGSLAGA